MAFYAPLFGWEFDDVGFATMIRCPGYGDHLEATVVDTGIRERQAGVTAPAGFEDAIAWLVPLAEGESDRWQVTFTVATETNRRRSPKGLAPRSFRQKTRSGRRPHWCATRRARS